jgi:hypothetical protein
MRLNVIEFLYSGPEEKDQNNPRQGLYLARARNGLHQPCRMRCGLSYFLGHSKLFLDTEVDIQSTHRDRHHGSNSLLTAVRPRPADRCSNSDCTYLYSRFLIRHNVLTSLPLQTLLVLTSIIIYGCYLHPLAHVPGPFLAKFSPVGPSNPD